VFDPRQNIFGGAQYLRVLLDLFRGNVDLALAAYNAGENAVIRHNGVPPYRETRNYLRKIRTLVEGTTAFVIPASAAALSYAPGGTFGPPRRTPTRLTPARPCVYYKYVDGRGMIHVTRIPPAEGISYTMLRALD
jgi:hypothetical protein